MANLLLLEDDLGLIDGLQYTLKKNGYGFDLARTVGEAKGLLIQSEYDLLLLDVALPDGNGFSLCEWFRGMGGRAPILFLTAADEEMSIIHGLDCGGDDYLTKPFKTGELFSRIRALLRRAGCGSLSEGGKLCCGDLVIDLARGRAQLCGRALELTLGEYKLLCLLVQHRGRVVSREVILNALWDQYGNYVDGNTVSVYIRRLREKVEDAPSHPRRLVTVRGFGYRWNEVPE